MENIVIVGGGLSSRLMILNLLFLSANREFTITVIEKNDRWRLGDTFCTENDFHLLNVPVSKVSIDESRPLHFLSWLEQKGYSFTIDSFVPRKIYKTYINETVEMEASKPEHRVRVIFLTGEVTNIEIDNKFVVIDGNDKLIADMVILAIGNYEPANINLADDKYLTNKGYHRTAWKESLYSSVRKDDRVFIIGTGLTMIDVILSLKEIDHYGDIIAISTHGFLPVSHEISNTYPSYFHELDMSTTALDLFKVIRSNIFKAAEQGINWQAVIDALRPDTPKLWSKLSNHERKKFIEHLRHIWGRARHRMPPENAQAVNEILSSGRLSIKAGRIQSILSIAEYNFKIGYKSRQTGEIHSVNASQIINCMGPAANLKKIKQPLLINLFRKGVIEADDLGLGINCLPDGAVIDKDGRISNFLFTIGPPRKGILWESTAIPELRAQAKLLSELIIS